MLRYHYEKRYKIEVWQETLHSILKGCVFGVSSNQFNQHAAKFTDLRCCERSAPGITNSATDTL